MREGEPQPPVNFVERRYQQLLEQKRLLMQRVMEINGEIARYPWGQPSVSERVAGVNPEEEGQSRLPTSLVVPRPGVVEQAHLPNDLLIMRATDQPTMPSHRIWDSWQEL